MGCPEIADEAPPSVFQRVSPRTSSRQAGSNARRVHRASLAIGPLDSKKSACGSRSTAASAESGDRSAGRARTRGRTVPAGAKALVAIVHWLREMMVERNQGGDALVS